MKKLLATLLLLFLIPCVAYSDDEIYNKPIPKLNTYSTSDNIIFDDFYTFYTYDNGYVFKPLTRNQYKHLTANQKEVYKNIVKANKYWVKGSKCSVGNYSWKCNFNKALSYNRYLYPVKLALALYCIDKKDFLLAEFYLDDVPEDFDEKIFNQIKLEIFYHKKDYFNALKCIDKLIEYYKTIDYDKFTDKVLSEYLISTNKKEVRNGYNLDCKFIQPNKDLRMYYERKYKLCKEMSNNKLAIITAEEMIKIWGYNEDFNHIKSCISNGKERIKNFEKAKTIYEQRKDYKKVKYINTLIYDEKYAMTHKNKIAQTQKKTTQTTKNVGYTTPKLTPAEKRELQRDMMLIDIMYQLQLIEYQQMVHNLYCEH